MWDPAARVVLALAGERFQQNEKHIAAEGFFTDKIFLDKV